MNRFAFIIHPTDLDYMYFILGWMGGLLKILPKQNAKQILKYILPYRYLHVKNIYSIVGTEVEGDIIVCPLLPEQFATLNKSLVLNKIIAGGKIAQNLGAKIVGLAGFNSIFSNQGVDLVNELNIAVTTGNTYTASLVVDGVLESSKLLNFNLESSHLAIIGATGDIGSICAEFFAPKVKRLLLVARDQQKLEELSSFLMEKYNVECKVEKSPQAAACHADIIITATSSLTTILDSEDLKKGGVIICDVSVPANVARGITKSRKDIFVFEGGYVKMPFFEKIHNNNFRKHFRHSSIFGCLAETIILALEGKLENFSLGRGNITIDKMMLIRKIGEKHGFHLSPFFCGDKVYSKGDIEKLRKDFG